jgi:hypothetical protein
MTAVKSSEDVKHILSVGGMDYASSQIGYGR